VRHARLDDEIRERAALYALGALEPPETAAFAAHLAEGCAPCRAEVGRLTTTAGGLGYTAAAARPDATLRDRLLARLPAGPNDAITVMPAAAAVWRPAPTPGLTVRRLGRDATAGTVTDVVRLGPGVTYPSHRHACDEETYMLGGDVSVNGETIAVGDYCLATTGSLHSGIHTAGGCEFLAVHSERNAPAPAEEPPPLTGLVFARAADAVWRPGGSEGVHVRSLLAQPDGRTTLIVRMEPGARLPAHRHAAAEQCYVLSGERRAGERLFRAGDYWRAEAGSLHEASESPGGCTYLLLASYPEASA
jgi:anti-sigma factor ChrR (cupin superfamily)